ncbi:MAG: hypothetical protein HXS54_18175 [Theionarchaea archaeon]|nr:hypothetical protein [Theionarchaea archaeon]
MKHKVLVILIFLTFFSACGEQSKNQSKESDTQSPDTQIPLVLEDIPLPESRGFDMAISPVFVLKDIQDRYQDLMKELASLSDSYFMQSDIIWDFEEGTSIQSKDYERDYLGFLGTAQSLKLKEGYVGISVFNTERSGILKNPYSDKFSDERVRRAYKNMALRVLKDFKPTYLCLGVEVSAYSHVDPADFEHFVSLYNETYAAIKDISPQTIVFPTFHYEEFLGVLPWNPHNPDWDLIQKFNMDAFALSTYPYMRFSLEDIPEDYYTQIRKYTNLPVIIAESGFASECCGKVIKDMHGSEEAQKDFLLFLLESIEEINPLLWVYWSLYDYEPLSWGGTDKNDVFNSIGLKYPDGTPKLAFFIWEGIFKLPKS